jgi:hypothetical protein
VRRRFLSPGARRASFILISADKPLAVGGFSQLATRSALALGRAPGHRPCARLWSFFR